MLRNAGRQTAWNGHLEQKPEACCSYAEVASLGRLVLQPHWGTTVPGLFSLHHMLRGKTRPLEVCGSLSAEHDGFQDSFSDSSKGFMQ